jgi:menaquinone-9 beta-reductase
MDGGVGDAQDAGKRVDPCPNRPGGGGSRMLDVYDVAVVGAGPGGSNAAAEMLRKGLSVIQFDRRRFPRMKPCGGGMTIKACNALQLALNPSVIGSFDVLESNRWHSRTNRYSHRGPILKMVFRPQFDNSLVEQNLKWPNFAFCDSEKVTSVHYDGLFRVETDKRSISARQLVGADGAYSAVAKTFGISQPRAFATAIELNLGRDMFHLAGELVPCFDFGAVDRGYGWTFPKQDHINVGLYTFARGLKNLRPLLLQYLEAKGITLKTDTALEYEAHEIPVGGFSLHPPKSAPVYVVGDAGGFADALSGEGIFHALESGRLAGITAAEHAGKRANFRRYYRRLWYSVLPDTLLSYYLSKFFYKHIDASVRILESPLIWRPFIEGYASGATLTQCIALGGYFHVSSLLRHTLGYNQAV